MRKPQKMNGIQKMKMSNDVSFKFLNFVLISEESKRNGVPQAGTTKKETVDVEFSFFIIKRVGPRFLSSVTLLFM